MYNTNVAIGIFLWGFLDKIQIDDVILKLGIYVLVLIRK